MIKNTYEDSPCQETKIHPDAEETTKRTQPTNNEAAVTFPALVSGLGLQNVSAPNTY